ncbi:hypothetical protein ACFY7H_14095 [Streptomyces sp. NPDC012794]|uniref:hypothetical protein n=1 Tax=Streptomyces sp. NPDC012794 TaxID=3364850 RepID=UPI0036BFDB5E
MLRLHFTAQDLARVRVALLGPLAETELSLWNLQRRDAKALFGGWRARTGPLITGDGPDTARFLGSPRGELVDLFTLVGAAGRIDEGVERLRGAPGRRLRAEFAVVAGAPRRHAPWLAEVVDAGPRGVARLATALQDCHRVAVAPYWERIQQHLEAELARRGRLMVQGGVGALLDGLRPMAPVGTARAGGPRLSAAGPPGGRLPRGGALARAGPVGVLRTRTPAVRWPRGRHGAGGVPGPDQSR